MPSMAATASGAGRGGWEVGAGPQERTGVDCMKVSEKADSMLMGIQGRP